MAEQTVVNGTKVRVLIAEDHTVIRDGLRVLLDQRDDIKVIGEASDAEETISKVEQLKPDVIIMDVTLSGMRGFEAVQHITRQDPKAKILMLTQHCDREHIISSIKAGALGYVSKQATTPEVVAAIHAVNRGDSFLYPSVAATLIHEYMRYQSDTEIRELTIREREVLKMIAEGHTSRQIAAKLCISKKTVMGHRNNMMKKLSLHKQAQLIKYAIREGLVGIES